jgi:hypothetical protein
MRRMAGRSDDGLGSSRATASVVEAVIWGVGVGGVTYYTDLTCAAG